MKLNPITRLVNQGISRERQAKKTGLFRSEMSLVERGHRRASLRIRERYHKAFKIDYWDWDHNGHKKSRA